LKPSTLLNFLQDLATVAAENSGFGYSIMSQKELCWFLIKYRMEFYDYPVNHEEIKIVTEARGVSKLMTQRDFEIYSMDDKLLGRITSHWLIADIHSRGLVQIKDVFPQMPTLQKREDDLRFDKIRPIDRIDNEIEFKIRYDDLDVNEHANNANYITWALESLSYDFRNKYKIKFLDMYFKKEIRFGGNVVSQVMLESESLTTTHVLKSKETGDDLCFVKIQWETNE